MNSRESDAAPELPSDRLPASAVDAAGLGWRPVRCASPRKRLCLSLLLSLLAHALLLSLTFSGQEFGLPGFGFPWQDRRIEVPDLHVVLAPAPLTDPKPAITSPPLPLPPVSIEQTVAAGPAAVTFRSPQQPPTQPARATVARSTPKAKASPKPKSKPKAATASAPAKALADLAPASKSLPTVIALDESKEAEFFVPPTPLEPAPAGSAAPGDAGGAAPSRIDHPAREQIAEEEARVESAQQEAPGQEVARLEAAREEVVRGESVQLEADHQESARQAAARQELAHQEVARTESMRLEAERQESARQAAARQELARQEVARAESARVEAERQESARQVAARQELARQEAARAESARLEAERQESVRQALPDRSWRTRKRRGHSPCGLKPNARRAHAK